MKPYFLPQIDVQFRLRQNNVQSSNSLTKLGKFVTQRKFSDAKSIKQSYDQQFVDEKQNKLSKLFDLSQKPKKVSIDSFSYQFDKKQYKEQLQNEDRFQKQQIAKQQRERDLTSQAKVSFADEEYNFLRKQTMISEMLRKKQVVDGILAKGNPKAQYFSK